MAAPNVAATSYGYSTSSGTSAATTFPTGTTAGDLVLIFLSTYNQAASTPAGWTLVTTSSGVGSVYARVIEAGDSAPTFTFADNQWAWAAYRYDGSLGSFDETSVEASSWITGSGGHPDAPALTPSWGEGEYSWVTYLYATYVVFANNLGAPSGWTADFVNSYSAGASTGTNAAVVTKDATAATQDPGNWQHYADYSSHYNRTVTLAVRFGADRTFTPDPLGAEAGFQTGVALAVGADVGLFPERIGAEAGFQPGIVFDTLGPRQVMLTGNGAETTEFTEGGAEGQVLTYHEGSKPSWGDGGGGVIDHGGLSGLGDDDHPQYATIAEVIALLTPDWYTCDSMTVDSGTLDTGAHTDLHATGGTTVGISEVAGAPGISVTLAFSGVDALTQWEVVGFYQGSASHHVHIQLWNYDTSAWVTVATMDTGTSARVYSGALTDGAPYFDGGGNAQMRFYHDEAGNITHDLYLDYVVIGHTEGGGVPAIALDDLTDVDAAAPNDADVLTWDDYAGEWVAAAPAGGALALDDLTDVDAAAPGDGQALIWDDYAGEWVPGDVSSAPEVFIADAEPADPGQDALWVDTDAVGSQAVIEDVLELPAAETDTDLRLAPDGAGGIEWVAKEVEYHEAHYVDAGNRSASFALRGVIPEGAVIDAFVVSGTVNGTNTGSAYWGFTLYGLPSSTVVASLDTSGVSGSAYFRLTDDSITQPAAGDYQFIIDFAKVGSPSNLYASCVVRYHF